MDAERFDLITRTLGRRGLIGLLLGLIGSGGGLAAAPGVAAGITPLPIELCPKLPEGRLCHADRECCSGHCLRPHKKKKKGKKGKKGKKKSQTPGTCGCSPLRAPCREGSDCCLPSRAAENLLGPVCTRRGDNPEDDPAAVCCMPPGATCSSAADCCDHQASCTDNHCEVND